MDDYCYSARYCNDIPGLALFYGGLVRAQEYAVSFDASFCNVLLDGSDLDLWGYSLAATEGNAFIGDLSKMFLKGVTPDS